MRRQLNYANVVATMALVFSMGSGALAASHYLINSTNQINPKVLRKLVGKPGPMGATGSTGAEGKEGKTGSEGKEGKAGPEGKEGKSGPEGIEGKTGSEGKEGKTGLEGKEGKTGLEGKEGPEGGKGLTTEEREELKALLPHIKYVASGVAGKPTIQFTGINVQVVNGEGSTASINGEGNLVIGYDEPGAFGDEQTGSHNLVLGVGQTFTSYAGIVAGHRNTISAPFASVTGGAVNEATGTDASVSGGEENKATNEGDTVSGGNLNTASASLTSVSGGQDNKATALLASVGGGEGNTAGAPASSISGGYLNTISGPGGSWVGGGSKNLVEGRLAAIFGGKELTAKNEYEAIP